MSTAVTLEQLHERTDDGRERHYMECAKGFWVCPCGEIRDRFGRPVEQRPVPVVSRHKPIREARR